MKVIHFITAIDRSLGGVSMYMQLLTKELGKLVDLIIVTRPTPNPLALENCKIIYLPRPFSQLKQFSRQWQQILNDEKPDVVHVNGIWMIQTWIIQKEALKMGITTYITPHGMLEPWILHHNRWKKKVALFLFQKKALKKAKALIATAENEKRHIQYLKYNSNVIFIPSGIDTFTIPIKKDWNIKKEILYLSRIHEVKGVELLIEAAILLKGKLAGCRIIIAGEGNEEYVKSLKKKIREANLTGLFEFIGGVYGDDKWNLYQKADFFVLPTHSENFGYVIAESLASGTPVITTQGAPWEDIETYHCGYWIPRNLSALVQAMAQLLSSTPQELEAMGKNGRRLIEEKYSAQVMAKKIFDAYNK